MPARKPRTLPDTDTPTPRARMGRPTKLNQICRTLPGEAGAPDRQLTVAESILQDLRMGSTLRWAIGRAGITMATVQDWARQGTRINTDLAQSKRTLRTLTADERRLLDFSYQLDQAEAEGKLRHFGSVASAGLRPQITRKTSKVVEVAANGDRTERTVEIVEERPPDWKASLAILERTDPEFISRTVAELTGEGGGPVAVEITAATVLDKLRRMRESAGIIDVASEEVSVAKPPAGLMEALANRAAEEQADG